MFLFLLLFAVAVAVVVLNYSFAKYCEENDVSLFNPVMIFYFSYT